MLGGPFVGLLKENGIGQTGDSGLVRKDADYVGAPLRLVQ
jgi:hypothetical protein